MTRECSNTTTGTNYGGEGEVRDAPSVQAIDGVAGTNGPYLELVPNRYTNVPEVMLTKTHCTGFCTSCGPKKLVVETPRSFMRGCLSGSALVQKENGLESVEVIYEPSLVTKSIHLFRHPLDNIVANFHLVSNQQRSLGNDGHAEEFPKNKTGFQKWCRNQDKVIKLLETNLVDDELKESLVKVPCFNEFFKYVQVRAGCAAIRTSMTPSHLSLCH